MIDSIYIKGHLYDWQHWHKGHAVATGIFHMVWWGSWDQKEKAKGCVSWIFLTGVNEEEYFLGGWTKTKNSTSFLSSQRSFVGWEEGGVPLKCYGCMLRYSRDNKEIQRKEGENIVECSSTACSLNENAWESKRKPKKLAFFRAKLLFCSCYFWGPFQYPLWQIY